ncbi:hypothetical protein P7C71_g2226, partial [Lecanoromycetidae sp. Uapishka_2]
MALALLRSLTRVPDSEISADELCDICYRPYGTTIPGSEEPLEFAVRLACNHVFGSDCIDRWLSPERRGKNTCPTCRHELYTKTYTGHDDESDEEPDEYSDEEDEQDAEEEEGQEEHDEYLDSYDDDDFGHYLLRQTAVDSARARFLGQYRLLSYHDDTFDPEADANEVEGPEQREARQDWNEEWQIIFFSLHGVGHSLEQQWRQWHRDWISHAMHPTSVDMNKAEAVLERMREGLPDWWRPAFYIDHNKIVAMAAARATVPYRECRLYWQLLGPKHDQFRAPPASLTPEQGESLFVELQRRKAFYPIVRQGNRFWSESTKTAEAWDVDYLCENGYGLSEREQWEQLRE